LLITLWTHLKQSALEMQALGS